MNMFTPCWDNLLPSKPKSKENIVIGFTNSATKRSLSSPHPSVQDRKWGQKLTWDCPSGENVVKRLNLHFNEYDSNLRIMFSLVIQKFKGFDYT